MKYSIHLLFILLLLIQVSCKNEKSPIPESEFITILTEMHIADAVLASKGLNDRMLYNDSLSYYNFIFKKYHINQSDFEAALNYYASNPDNYNKIYKKIVENFEEKEKIEQAQMESIEEPKDPNDLWPYARRYSLPRDGEREPIKFVIKVTEHGVYQFKAKIRMFPDDGTVDPSMTVYLFYKDGSSEFNENKGLIKDGVMRDFLLEVKTNDSKELDRLEGWLLNHSDGTTTKHSEVRDISLKLIKPE